jgi:gamma-glutamyl-gamma-aminobutyrate hydrolase PuuD
MKSSEKSEIKKQKTAITIGFRDDGRGKGWQFDEKTIGEITGSKIRFALSDKQKQMPYTPPEHTYAQHDDYGLLLIPGMSRNSVIKESRKGALNLRIENDKALLRQAINKGQPILTICGGTRVLWQVLGSKEVIGQEKQIKFRPLVGHHHNSPPLSLSESGEIQNNIVAHGVNITKGSLLEAFSQTDSMHVNSIHWDAVDETIMPPNVNISARSFKDRFECDEQNTVEAFETIHGAPIMGLQWHIEASLDESIPQSKAQRRVINEMKKAGEAFAAKREMLVQFHRFFKPCETMIKPSSCSKLTQEACKQSAL